MSESESSQQYTVVARRYRPQSFTDLVGQSHISRALGNAISQNRVGHAYLFTGARGVGKTSSARIFAKCLNCKEGPTSTPCNVCDICESVSLGEDVDVLEIDGASNRGIDEIRQLRSNAGVRPSRSKFKIYIIDEVHMLTPQAFNALLKTLEEPPEHVKFIFCTTDPQKIPITVLSRCQRFDFSPVQPNEITQRLKEIAENEGVKADEKALSLLARRAAGSMRDSQSLLEQLFSFCGDSISVEEVHQLLGTTDVGRIAELAQAMASHDSKAAIERIAKAVADGVDTGQLASQLLAYFRDMMACHVGCGLETMLSCAEEDIQALETLSKNYGLETILNVVQILDATVSRMQSSVHSQTLLEVAVVRICNLESLDSLADLVQGLTTGKTLAIQSTSARNSENTASAGAQDAAKKNDLNNSPLKSAPAVATQSSSHATAIANEEVANNVQITSESRSGDPIVSNTSASVVESSTPISTATVNATAGPSANSTSDRNSSNGPATAIHERTDAAVTGHASSSQAKLTKENVTQYWKQAISQIGDMTAEMVAQYKKLELAGDGALVVTMPNAYNRDMCNQSERRQKIESTFEQVAGIKLRIDFVADNSPVQEAAGEPKLTRRQQLKRLQDLPFVKKALEIFDADIVDYREPQPQKT